MPKKDIHVVPHKDGWATRREGATRVGVVAPTKADALSIGRDQARRDKVELVVHGRNGRIQDCDSYGNDPFPPRDKKR